MLSKEEVRLIQRIRSGRFPHVEARPALGNHACRHVSMQSLPDTALLGLEQCTTGLSALKLYHHEICLEGMWEEEMVSRYM